MIHAERIKPRTRGAGGAGKVPTPDFRALFQAVPDPCLVLDRELRVVAVTDSYLRITMTRREDIVGRGILELFPDNPEDHASSGVANLMASLKRVLAEKLPDDMAVQRYDLRAPESEGGGFRERYWNTSNSPVLGADGEVLYVMHRVQDITDFVMLKQERIKERKISLELRERSEAEIFAISQQVARTNEELKRTVAALHDSERLFNSFMAHLPAAAWIKDLEGRYVFANSEMERLFNRSVAELVGKTGAEVFPPEMAYQFRESDLRVIREGGSDRPFEVVRQAGEGERYLMSSKFPIPGAEGEAEFVAGLAFDVTETKRLQSEVEWLASFPVLNPHPVIEVDAEGAVTFLNPAARALLEGTEYAPGGNPLVPPNLRELFESGASGEPAPFSREVEIGGRFYEEVVTLLPQQKRVRCYTMDVTMRRRAEQEREQLLLQLEAVLEWITEGVVISDLQGRLTAMNREALALHEFQSVEQVQRHVSEFPVQFELFDMEGRGVPFDDWPLMRALRGERFSDYELRVLNRVTGRRWIASYGGGPVVDREGKVILAVLSLRDITARKELEARLATLNADLEHRVAELQGANLELEAFNRMVSHDLRNPLNTIGTSCQAVQMMCGRELGSDCKRYVDIAYDKVRTMNALIEALLNFSRTTHAELKWEDVDLTALAQSVVAEVKLGEPGRRGSFVIAKGLSAYGDPNLLRSVLENLIGNAWKYTGHRAEALIEFGTTETEAGRTYFVRDNGNGFKAAEAAQLFTPFRRLPGAEQIKGFGIGLATVDRIIRRHGGRIWAEGAPGQGATFYFTLPVGESTPASESELPGGREKGN